MFFLLLWPLSYFRASRNSEYYFRQHLKQNKFMYKIGGIKKFY